MAKKHIKLPSIGKKKGGGAPAPKPASSGAPQGGSPSGLMDARPPAKKSAPPKKKSGGGIGKILPLVLIVVVVGVGAYFAYTRFFSGGDAPVENAAPAPSADVAPIPQGESDSAKALSVQPQPQAPVTSCAGKPKFLNKLGFDGEVTFSTNAEGVRGLLMVGATSANSDAVSSYQHQSWSRAGFLDAFVFDQNGNGFFAPSPRTGLGVDVPQNQDQIFKLNSRDGELASFVTLSSAAPASPENPFGVLGLAYDCASQSLYAATVMGSTNANPVGRIFRIDTGTGEIVGQRENVDAYGLAVRATANGRQLIFGSPHDSAVRALDIDANGNFQGDPRTIATLQDPLRARKISFPNENEMLVQGAEFNFANVAIPTETETRLTYDAASDKWQAQ